MTTVGEAAINLIGNSAPLKNTLAEAKGQTDSWAKGVGENLNRNLGSSIGGGIKNAVSSILGTFATAGLAIGGAERIGEGIKSALEAPISAALNLNKQIEQTGVIFGRSGSALEAWAKGTANSLGLAEGEALQLTVQSGRLFTNMGIGQQKSADMSEGLTKLAVSEAALLGIPVDVAYEKLYKGVAGGMKGLKDFGIVLTDAQIKQEAVSLGLAKSTKNVDVGAMAQARYALILKETTKVQDYFAQHQDKIPEAERRISASFANLKETIGNALLPTVSTLIAKFADALPKALTKLTPIIGGFAKTLEVAGKVGSVVEGFFSLLAGEGVSAALGNLKPLMDLFGWDKVLGFATAIDSVVETIKSLGTFLDVTVKSGLLFTGLLNRLPAPLRPVALLLGGITLTLRGLAKAFADLVTGKIDLAGFFQRVGQDIKQNGHIIWDAFAAIGKGIWDYLFLKDDTTGQSRAGDLVTAAKGWVSDKAKAAFGATESLGLSLYDWIFGTPSSTGGTSADSFLTEHKGLLKTAATMIFGPLGGLAVSLLGFIFGATDAKGGQAKATDLLKTVKGWFSPENVSKALGTATGIITDIWGFLFGHEEKGVDAGMRGATVWATGIVQQLWSSIKSAVPGALKGLASIFADIDIGAFLFGHTEQIDASGHTRTTNGLIPMLTSWFKDAVSNLPWGEVWSSISSIGTNIATQLPSIVSDLEKWLQGQIGGVSPATIYKNLPGPPSGTWNPMTGYIDLSGIWSAISSFFTDLPGKIKTAADSTATSPIWAQIGKTLGDAIVNPIKAGIVGSDDSPGLGTRMIEGISAELQAVSNWLSLGAAEAQFVGALAVGFATLIVSMLDKAEEDITGVSGSSRLRDALGITTSIGSNGSTNTTGRQNTDNMPAKVLGSPLAPGAANPLTSQMATLFDPVALGIDGLGEKIGDSLLAGMAKSLANGQSGLAVLFDAILTPRLLAAQVQIVDGQTGKLNPYRKG